MRGVYRFFCAFCTMVAQKHKTKHTNSFFKMLQKLFPARLGPALTNLCLYFSALDFLETGEIGGLVQPYLQMLLLVGIRVHEHAQASEIVFISKYRTCARGREDNILITPCVNILRWCSIFFILTFLHAFFRVPNGQTITVEVLLSLPMNLKVHLHFPVLQMARLREEF